MLIVEDEAQVLMLAESYLAEHGYDAHSASSVAEALAVLDSDAPVPRRWALHLWARCATAVDAFSQV